MDLDINYYRNYISSSGNPSDRLQDLADRYSEQLIETISKFNVLITSDRADIIYRSDIPYKCIIDYGIQVKQSSLKDYTREIWTIHSDNFKVGDSIQLENKVSKEKESYLFVGHRESKDGYDVSTIQKTNNTLKFYSTSTLLADETPILYEIPCIVSDKITLGTQENQHISLPAKTVMVTIPNNTYASEIYEDQRFVLGKNTYKCEGIDDITTPGLLNLRMSQTQKNESDNIDNGIAVQNDNTKGGW